MPPTPRERFNAKARRSVAGESSHKKKRVKKPNKNEGEGQEHPDANTEILVEKTKEEKEQHRREILRQEVCLVALRVYGKRRRPLTERFFAVVVGCARKAIEKEAEMAGEVYCKFHHVKAVSLCLN